MKTRNLFIKILIPNLILCACVGIWIFLFGDFNEVMINILFTTLLIGIYCLTGLSCAALLKKGRFQIISQLGMGVSIFGLFVSILGIWWFNRFESFWQLTITFTILSFGMAHICLLLLLEPKNRYVSKIVNFTTGVISMVVLMLIWSTVTKFSNGEMYFRVLGVFAILDILGTSGALLVNKMY